MIIALNASARQSLTKRAISVTTSKTPCWIGHTARLCSRHLVQNASCQRGNARHISNTTPRSMGEAIQSNSPTHAVNEHLSEKAPKAPKTSKISENGDRSREAAGRSTGALDETVAPRANGPTIWSFLTRSLAPLNAAANAYSRIQDRRPWTTQLCASSVVYLCGDLLAQYIDGEKYNPWRTARHLTIGAGFAIPGYSWFMWLNNHFNYSSQLLSLATKVVVNQLVFTSIFNSYFFAMQSLLSGASVHDAYERVKNTLPTSFINSCKLWPAVTAFSFTYIQPQFRFLFAGGVAVGWQSYLSWLNQRAAERERQMAVGQLALAES